LTSRREQAWDCGRGQQHVPEQLERAGIAARSDAAHIPDHRPLRIEIGGADQESAAPRVLVRDLLQEFRRDVARDHAGERRVARKRITAEEAADRMFGHQLIGGISGVDRLQSRVVARPEKGERRRQRAGADAGDDVEFGTVATRGPADQEACAECAIGAAAGNGEEAHQRPLGPEQFRAVRSDLRPFLRRQSVDVGRRTIAPVTDLSAVENGRLSDEFGCDWIAGQPGASGDQQSRKEREPPAP
jgi:hypothetical protein